MCGREAIYVHKAPLCSLLPRGLECPEIPRFPASGLSDLSCPFKTSKKHSPIQNNNNNERGNRKKKKKKKGKNTRFFFVLRRRSQAPAHWSCCPVSLAPGSLSLQGFQKAPVHRSHREKRTLFFVLRRWSHALAHQSHRFASLATGSLSL